jgi:hypothetical protein
MDANVVLILLCSAIVFSYFYEAVARRTRFPAALLLMSFGMLLQLAADAYGIGSTSLRSALPVLGTIGLILIVLEGSLELRFDHERRELIVQAFTTALSGLVLSVGLFATLIVLVEHVSIHTAIISAIPGGVISSAIAIPSVRSLRKSSREFIVYESAFADILGVMLFNFVQRNEGFSASSVFGFASETLLVGALSVGACLVMLYLMAHITHHVKFFLLITILILAYAIGKVIHLPSLIVVLLFGLLLNNTDRFKQPWFVKHFRYDGFESDMSQFRQITAETAFVVRSFFFLVFGFTMDTTALTRTPAVLHAIIFFGIILLTRFVILRLAARDHVIPELFVAPRGLISILLFLSIPIEDTIVGYRSGMLFVLVLTSGIFMSGGLLWWHRHDSARSTA